MDDGVLCVGDEPDAVPRARRFVADQLSAGGLAGLRDDAGLVVTELVTNGLLHAGAPVTVRVRACPRGVRIEVRDRSRVAPVHGPADPDAMTGRGLALVTAVADRCGVEPFAEGKTIWCELTGIGHSATEGGVDVESLLATWGDLDGEPAERRFTVSLGDVPTDLLLAAKAHVENLVREFTLAASGAAAGQTAAAPPHLVELIETVTTRFAEPRQAIKRQALAAAERGDPRTRLTLTLPLSAAEAGEEYLAALDEADAYARAARLLTLESPPQHRVFRRWYVAALVGQLRRAAGK